MAHSLDIVVNGQHHNVQAAPETPLLYVLRNELGLSGPYFGSGEEKCGACMILLGSKATQSCKLPVSEVGSARITTLEGLIDDGELHPGQRAFLETQAAQWGYCTNGMIMVAAALPQKIPHRSDEQIRSALDGNLCRCGSHLRILRALRRTEALMAEELG